MTDSAPRNTLQSLWLALTGGEAGCPRKRFFISLLPAAALLGFLSSLHIPSLFEGMKAHQDSFLFLLLLSTLNWVGNVLGSIACNPLTALGLELGRRGVYIPLQEQFLPGGWLHAFSLYLVPFAALCAGVVSFCLAWRRLSDAGYSHWHLLAGLTPLPLWYVFCVLLEVPGNSVSDFLLCNLGSFWLLYLYCQPTAVQADAPTPPAP